MVPDRSIAAAGDVGSSRPEARLAFIFYDTETTGTSPAFKLGDLARANGIDFTEEEAHDVLADVRATVKLAQLMRERVPAIWEQMLINATKHGAIEFMSGRKLIAIMGWRHHATDRKLPRTELAARSESQRDAPRVLLMSRNH